MERLLFSVLLVISVHSVFAQKETFDVVSYKPIAGWKKERTDKVVSFSKTDEAKGTFCIISIYPSIDGDADSKTNFDHSWQKIVQESLGAGDAKMEAVSTENGWELQTGSAQFNKGGLEGTAMLITASSQNKTVNLLVLLNSDAYNTQLNGFINSIDLKKIPATNNNNTTSGATSNSNAGIVGIWANNLLETSGYANGFPQYTAGYFRKEYTFKSDGTYLFFHKTWSVYVKPIRYIYETGNWSVSGNKLTISPTKGRAEEWSKAASGRASEWGTLIKSKDAKLEKVTYSFEIKYYSGSQSTALLLTSDKPTERDGSSNNNGGAQTNSYSWRKDALIDFPPGFKISAARPVTSSLVSNNSVPAQTSVNAPLAGKIWEANSPEKYGAAYGDMSGYYTGGYWMYQYKFNSDGTYRFVYNGASGVAVKPVNVLQYETGVYTVNGDQLVITPLKGTNEEWTVGAITNGMSDTHRREVLETRLKKIKTSTRKLEKIAYPFTVEYWQGNNANALCLKHSQDTQREGIPGANNLSCFFETATAKSSLLLPDGFK